MATTIHRTPAPSRNRPTFVPALGLLALAVAALLITGTILTLGLILIPTLLLGVLAYALWQHRRTAPVDPAPIAAVVPDDASSSASQKSA